MQVHNYSATLHLEFTTQEPLTKNIILVSQIFNYTTKLPIYFLDFGSMMRLHFS